MVETIRRALRALLADRMAPLLLLAVGVLAYGLLLAFQGFYWDDFPLIWIAHTYGLEGLARYFSTNRPLWGLLYQVSNALLGEQPWQWQIFGLFWRWASAVIFWLLLRQLWQRQAAACGLAALALLVYPGFGQQAIGMVYGHFFWVLSFFFFSLYTGLRALRSPDRLPRLVWTALGLLASFANLVTMEYFFLLELARPLVYLLALRDLNPVRSRTRSTLLAWLPYLLVWIAVAAWRAFFFGHQTTNYAPVVLDALRANPLAAGLDLLAKALAQTLTAGLAAWLPPFLPPDLAGLGRANSLLYAAAALGGALLAGLWLRQRILDQAGESNTRRTALEMLSLGGFLLLIAGWPFFLTGLPVSLGFPNDRFTLPFMPGSALLLAGLFGLLPRRVWLQVLLAALLIGSASGYHFTNSTAYRRDWNSQKAFFWQLAWRVPGLAPGTTLVTNDLPLRFYSDNSLTAPLNWIYAPANRSQAMDYMLFYSSVRLREDSRLTLSPGLPIEVDYLAAAFSGSTDQVVVLYYQPPACLRILDGDIELGNLFLPLQIRMAAASLGSTAWIQPATAAPALPPAQYYGPEPARGWCYYFQKADLARQAGDWQTAAGLGDSAFELGDYPNDPAERMPFIEAYAHTGRWDDALDQTRQSAQISPAMQPVLCALWQRIQRETQPAESRTAALQTAAGELNCDFP